MATAVKEEVFEINGSTVGLETENDLTYATIDNSLQVIWEYEVPVGVAIIFTVEDILSAYLISTGSTEAVGATMYVDVVVMDSSKLNVRSILNVCQYENIKEFADADKLKHLDISAGNPVVANEGERICIRGNNRTSGLATLDASACYFRVTCKRIRHTLFS